MFYYAAFVTHRFTRVVIIIFTLLLAIASCVAATQLEQQFSLNWFIPSDSYLRHHIDATDEFFLSGAPLNVYGTAFDHAGNRESIREVLDVVDASPYVDVGTRGWLRAFDVARPSLVDAANDTLWRVELQSWLQREGRQYSSDVRFDDAGMIVASRHSAQFIQLNSSQEEVDAMQALRDDVERVLLANRLDTGDMFPFSFQFLFWEQYAVIYVEAARNLGLSIGVVFVISLFLLPQLVVALSVFLCVFFSLVDTLAVVYVVGQYASVGTGIDSVLVVFLVLSVGLSIDYSAHIGNSYLQARGGRRSRARDALSDVGTSVLNGAVSTFIAVVVLGFSDSYVFQTFFKVITSVIVFGVWHGMVWLPAVLSVFGPSDKRLRFGHEMKSARN